MKKLFLMFFLSGFLSAVVFSQTSKPYKIKAEYMHGAILKHNKHLENLATGPAMGGELAFEFQTMGEKAWHQYLNFPVVGLGLVFMDFSNPEMLGQGIGLYPYLNVPLIRTDYFSLNLKPGAGLSFLNKRYSNTPHQENTLNGVNGEKDYANAAIGSALNVFLSCGVNLEVPVAYGFSFTADYAWNHVSNGSIVQPNSGINMLNAYVGLKYAPDYKTYRKPERKQLNGLPRKFSYELTVSGGIRQLYYMDKGKNYGTGVLSFGVYRPMSNWYRMGVGTDVFYDGVFGAVNHPKEGVEPDTKFQRTYIDSDELKNKMRAGVSWQHEFIFGRFTAGFHFGLYLYDPVKNLEPHDAVVKNKDKLNKPLIYKYDINHEDGWLYTRAVAKYAITKHLFVSVGLKTHLQKAEFIDWGFGWKF